MSDTSAEARLGRRGICIKCGNVLSGSFVDCGRCGFIPVSELDLATALAVNEANQGARFTSLVNEVRSGAFLQLASVDIKRLIGEVRARDLRRVLGRDQKRYIVQDQLETFLSLAAASLAQNFWGVIKRLVQTASGKIDVIVVAGLVGNAALRGMRRAILDEDSRSYAIKALPFRAAKELCQLGALEIDGKTKAKLASSFGEVMAAVSEAETAIDDSESGDALLGCIVLYNNNEALEKYLSHSPGLLTELLGEIENDFAHRKYAPSL